MFQKNIYTDGTYFKNNPSWGEDDSEWKAEAIFSLIRKNKLVITDITDVGCGSGGILARLGQKMPELKKLRGYDISSQAIQLAGKYADDKLDFFNEDFALSGVKKSGLLLMIDVLEHVRDYYGFLRTLHSKAHNYIFHIPLDLSFRTILKPHVLLQQREAVGHIHYFSREMVQWMLQDTGFDILDWHYTKPVTDIRNSGKLWQGVKKAMRNISFSLNKNLSDKLWGNYSMMILARDKNE
jgi:SAM-dependent methyltransferase